MRNFYPRSKRAGMVVFALVNILWHALFVVGAWALYALLSAPDGLERARTLLPAGLLLAFLYWQVVPFLMMAAGSALDMKRLIVYPIPVSQLFAIETLLRLTTSGEMLILLAGVAAGLWRNPQVPWWAPFGTLLFILFNLLIAIGTREVLARLMARRGIREIAVLVVVLVSALPQLFVLWGEKSPGAISRFGQYLQQFSSLFLPWGAAATLITGQSTLPSLAALTGWCLLAYLYGRSQFDRSLRFDAQAAQSAPVRKSGGAWREWILRVPSAVFGDPLGALVEKEIRFLVRAPRFRLVFIMGFTFGLIIWIPLLFGRISVAAASEGDSNFLVYISLYSLLLLGDVCFWNSFGFDRSAAQAYFTLPVRFSTVLVAKNIAALIFVLLEITLIALVCLLLGFPIRPQRVAEAYAVTLMVSLFLLAVGNLTSVNYPRPVNPASSFRNTGSGKTQAILLLAYALCSIPVLLAFGARYALDSQWALYGAVVLCTLVGAMLYWVALDSALTVAHAKREEIIAALSKGEGPIT